MSKSAISQEQKTLLHLVACSLNNTKHILEEHTDFEELFSESKLQAVALQALDAIDPHSKPEQQEWKRYAVKTLCNNLEIHCHHGLVHQLMTENHIPYCILKGSASAFYYPRPDLRAMGDVDFLVKESDIPKATAILLQEGFVQEEGEHIHHIGFHKGKIGIELHFAPPGIPKGEAGEKVKKHLVNILETVDLTQVEGVTFAKPSHFHHGLILLMHTYNHLLSEGVGIRHLADWCAFINRFDSERFREVFEETLKHIGLWHFAKVLSGVCHLYLEASYQAWMGEVDEELSEKIIEDILKGGNFGLKDMDRADQGLAVSNRGKSGMKKPAILQFISSLNFESLTQIPVLQKVKILQPFGWIILGTRRLFRVVTGKRKMPKMRKVFKEAKKRKALYENFRLFETEDS